jgi:hypothetical protein
MICENFFCLLPSALCLASLKKFMTQIGLLYLMALEINSLIINPKDRMVSMSKRIF